MVENTGIPLDDDNRTIIKERISLDPSKDELINDEITIIDEALTRPWTVTRSFHRDPQPNWIDYVCQENNNMVILRGQTYYVREDGFLMPGGKDEPPPDLRYFDAQQK